MFTVQIEGESNNYANAEVHIVCVVAEVMNGYNVHQVLTTRCISLTGSTSAHLRASIFQQFSFSHCVSLILSLAMSYLLSVRCNNHVRPTRGFVGSEMNIAEVFLCFVDAISRR